jgi:hypothetical protein
MTDKAGAGAGEDPGQAGSGAPAGGSPEGGSEKDELDEKFEKRIKAALANQRAHYETQLGNVRAEFESFKEGVNKSQPAKGAEPKRYTRQDLKAGVDAGQISQEQADDVWAKQVENDAVERATKAATDAVSQRATKERIDTDIGSYKRLKPEIMENGSEVREKVREEYNYLVGLGAPGNTATELAAIRAVLGPLEKLEKSSSARRSEDHDQQGGSDTGGKPRGGSSKKLVDHLDARAKEHYEKGIKQGRYKDWTEVEAELKFATPARRAQMGLPA